MAQTLIRITAGIGALVVISVAGGHDAAVASAAAGDVQSLTGNSRHGRHPHGDGQGHRGHRRESHDGHRRGHHHRRDGPGAASNGSAARAAATSRIAVAGPEAKRGGGSSGLGGTGQAMSPARVLRVSFGDGRTPGPPSGRPDELPGPVDVAPVVVLLAPEASAPALTTLPVPSPPPSPRPRRAPAQHLEWTPATPVASFWGRVEPDWPAGVIFGIAGLLLAPVGGIWLGRRQAHASKAAARLVTR